MKILSFGEIIWDIYENGRFIGGAPLNFAAHMARRGAESYLLSAVGEDELGESAKKELRRMRIKTDFVAETDSPTGQCLVTLDQEGVPNYQVVQGVAYEKISLPQGLKEQEFSALAFGSLALRTAYNRKTLEEIIDGNFCKTVYCDLNLRSPFYTEETVRFCLDKANVLKLSEDELVYVKNLLTIRTEELKEVCRELGFALPNLQTLIVTLGEKGSCGYRKDTDEFIEMASKKVEVVSTVGAGDSFGAAFLSEYLKGEDLKTCLKEGAELSAYVVAHKAAVPD